MVDPVERDSRGLVLPEAGLRRFTLDRRAPSPPIARFVDRYWFVAWDLPPGHAHYQEVILHPTVNIVFEAGTGLVGGPNTQRFGRQLRGHGEAVGVMFRPGAFATLTDAPARQFRDARIPIGEVFGGAGDRLATALLATTGIDARTALLDGWFGQRTSDPAHPAMMAVDAAALVIADPTINRVDHLAAAADLSVRQLQRLFHDHVGMTPKQVIRRYRIYEAAERVAHGESVQWATVAAELGFADQAHLTREFTALFGMPPATYARLAARADAGM